MVNISSDSVPKVRNGSCLCGTVKYTLTGEPSRLYACHCLNCRKVSGTAFMVAAFFPDGNVKYVAGESEVSAYVDPATKSGQNVVRKFCKRCGSNLSCHPSKFVGTTLIPAGTIDDEFDWEIAGEVFKDEQRAWIPHVAG